MKIYILRSALPIPPTPICAVLIIGFFVLDNISKGKIVNDANAREFFDKISSFVVFHNYNFLIFIFLNHSGLS